MKTWLTEKINKPVLSHIRILSMECPDGAVVRRLFVFLKENLIFDHLLDELIQRDILNKRDIDDYICNGNCKCFKIERLIKRIIWKKRCSDFVTMMNEMPGLENIAEIIRNTKENALWTVEDEMQGNHVLTTNDEMLQKHFAFLYMKLEPREVAHLLFQSGHISVDEHDEVIECNRKIGRLKSLLGILKKDKLYTHFVCTLQCLKCNLVLETLQRNEQLESHIGEYELYIQHNFILLQTELPDPDHAKVMMEHELDKSNISDIESCGGKTRQISKLLKILLMKGTPSCKELLRVIKFYLKGEKLIQRLKDISTDKKKRGKPDLCPERRSLNISWLQENEEVIIQELDPLYVCDLLFEDRAIEIIEHDTITELKLRKEQVRNLLETVKENKNDCFHFFLYILQNVYNSIGKKDEKSVQAAITTESSENFECSASHGLRKFPGKPDDVQNESIEVKLKADHGSQGEQVLQNIHHSTGISEESISCGQMYVEKVSKGSVVLQLRPVTDQAVKTLLNARENNRLVEMITGMLQKADIAKIMDGTMPFEITVQVKYAKPENVRKKSVKKISRTTLIKHRMKANKNVLVSELKSTALVSVLRDSKAFDKLAIEFVDKVTNNDERVKMLLSLVENGNSDVVEEFLSALKDLNYCHIVELIDPADIHTKAELIREKITSNYKNILEEMQFTFAREVLSRCIGDVDGMGKKILPKNGNRRERMSTFLQFILQEDYNVIEFENILKNNGLGDLLKMGETIQREHTPAQDIEVTVVKDHTPSSLEEVLFESVITLSFSNIDKANKQNLGEVSGNTSVGDQQKDTERSQSPINIQEKHLQGSPSEHKMTTLSSAQRMAKPNLILIDLDSDEEEEENGHQENCHRTESPEMLVITKQAGTQQLPTLKNANEKEELVKGPKYGESEKGKELQLEPEHLVEKNRQSLGTIMITKQGETQQHPSLENVNKNGEPGMAPQYWESKKQLQVNPQCLAEKGGQPQRPKPYWNPDKGTKHWNDKYDKKKLPWDQRQKFSEKSYESQIQEVTEKVPLKFRFDKGQTRCYNKNSNLSKKVTKLQSEYLKDRKDGDSFDIIEENECLLIEIVGEESFGKKNLQQLQQLRNEMWTGSFDLFKISKEESDVALMSHGLQREHEFIARAEGSLACGIMVEKSSERVKHFISSSDHCFDEHKRSSLLQFPPPEDYGQQRDADQVTIRKTTIHVVNKDITQHKAKCLVNFFDKKSGLSSKGVVFRRFMEKGGEDMYEYLRNVYEGESVTVTQSSGNLDCQFVLHVALPEYQEGFSSKELQKIVQSCFTMCELYGDHDIAFPSLGVDHLLRYPADRVADVLIKESISMAEQGNKWKISFAVYDNKNFKIFKQLLSQTPGISRSYSTPDLKMNLPTTPMTVQRLGGQDKGRRPDTAHQTISVPKIEIYAISKEEGLSRRSELSHMIKEKYLHEQIKDIKTGELSKEDKKRVYAVGQKHGVFVSLDKDKHFIVLKGTPNSVSKTATEIDSILSSASSAVSPRRRKENCHQRGTSSYWKHLLEENPVPDYWKFFQDGKSFVDMIRGFITGSTEKRYEVDPKTFKAICKLVEDTFKPELVGAGADARNLNHKRLRVKKVEIIENLDLFKIYNIKRCEMLKNSLNDKRSFPRKLEKIPRCEGIQNVTSEGEIMTEKVIGKRLMKDIIPELNEVYLFHGTKKDFVANITSKGVDPKLGSDEGMFGRGVYGCESSTKADQYADDKDKRGTEGRMFLMRFLLGHMYLTEKPNKYKLPPCYHCRRDCCTNQSHQTYDSVVGVKQQSGGLFREFVVYEKNQCYPEYLITYTREN